MWISADNSKQGLKVDNPNKYGVAQYVGYGMSSYKVVHDFFTNYHRILRVKGKFPHYNPQHAIAQDSSHNIFQGIDYNLVILADLAAINKTVYIWLTADNGYVHVLELLNINLRACVGR